MYPPPPPPRPPHSRDVPRPAVAAIAVGCLLAGMLGGCVVGVGIGSAPPPTPPAAATATATPTPQVSETPSSPEPTRTRKRIRTPEPDPTPTRTRKKRTSEPEPPSLDPRYRTCGEANDHGLGPYRRGQDPEYSWYQDRDDDGLVCER